MIDLKREHLSEVKKILKEHVPKYEVRAFGSRIRGNARPFSDLDLAVLGNSKLDEPVLDALKDALSLSDLPIMVDIVEWFAISDGFRKIIDQQFEIIQKCST